MSVEEWDKEWGERQRREERFGEKEWVLERRTGRNRKL